MGSGGVRIQTDRETQISVVQVNAQTGMNVYEASFAYHSFGFFHLKLNAKKNVILLSSSHICKCFFCMSVYFFFKNSSDRIIEH